MRRFFYISVDSLFMGKTFSSLYATVFLEVIIWIRERSENSSRCCAVRRG